jgi:phage gp36-like protein
MSFFVAVQVSDLPQYVNPLALVDVPSAAQVQACTDANEVGASYLRGRFPVDASAPTVVGSDLKRYCAYIAIYQVLGQRGMNPSAGADSQIETNYREAVGYPDRPGSGWFPAVARGAIQPDLQFPAPPSPTFQLPQVFSRSPRGW